MVGRERGVEGLKRAWRGGVEELPANSSEKSKEMGIPDELPLVVPHGLNKLD